MTPLPVVVVGDVPEVGDVPGVVDVPVPVCLHSPEGYTLSSTGTPSLLLPFITSPSTLRLLKQISWAVPLDVVELAVALSRLVM